MKTFKKYLAEKPSSYYEIGHKVGRPATLWVYHDNQIKTMKVKDAEATTHEEIWPDIEDSVMWAGRYDPIKKTVSVAKLWNPILPPPDILIRRLYDTFGGDVKIHTNYNIREGWKDVAAAGLVGASSFLPSFKAGVKPLEQPTIQKTVTQELDMNKLIKFITKHEGKRNKVYKDSLGIPTIGVGFNLTRADAPKILKSLDLDYNKVLSGEQSLTDREINLILTYDINRAISDAKKFIKNFDTLPTDAKTAIIDMSFNMGLGRLQQFKKFKNAIETNNFELAAKEMKDSNWYKQVKNRGIELVRMVSNLA